MIGTCPVNRSRHGPSPRSERLGTVDDPAIRFKRGTYFGASWFALCCGLSGCSPPWTDLTGASPSHRGLLLPGLQRFGHPPRHWISLRQPLNTFCRWELHPLECQLASLHQIPACAANAPGSSLGSTSPWRGRSSERRAYLPPPVLRRFLLGRLPQLLLPPGNQTP